MNRSQSVTVPDQLHALFASRLMKQDGTIRIGVPDELFETDTIDPTEVYQIALIETTAKQVPRKQQQATSTADPETSASLEDRREPPVENGEIRTVTINTLGEQGDGIVRVDHGYVLIVEDAQPDEEVVVEIEQVQSNVAFATVVKRTE